MRAGDALLDLVLAEGSRSVFVVGTAKNVGKTVTMRALAAAAAARGLGIGVTSTGRDGEAIDAADARAKPRLFLTPPALIATARSLLPAHPASEVAALTDWKTAAGDVLFARVRRAGHFEIAGPSTASALRECVDRFFSFGCELAIVDGALDRIAALSGARGAVIIAAGAASANTMDEAVDDARALACRLRIPRFDPLEPHVRVQGAFTPADAAALIARRETRQIVVADPTCVIASGKALIGIVDRLDLRCEHPFSVVAASVASIGTRNYFEPREFAAAVAKATRLPTFDVYAARESTAA
jgi:hypothetical protein